MYGTYLSPSHSFVVEDFCKMRKKKICIMAVFWRGTLQEAQPVLLPLASARLLLALSCFTEIIVVFTEEIKAP